MSIIIDPEFKALIPPQTEEERKGLEASLKAQGCRDALVIWNGILLDGHNRYDICTKYGIPFKTVQAKNISDRVEAINWIIDNQLGRRNLQNFQRIELALKRKPAIEAKAKENQGKRNDLNILVKKPKCSGPISTHAEIAKVAGTGITTVQKGTKIIEKGTPEQQQRARAGGKGNSISAIYNEITGAETEKIVCSYCGKEKYRKSFLSGGDICRECRIARTGEENKAMMKHIEAAAAHLKDHTAAPAYGEDDLADDIETAGKACIRQINMFFDMRKEVLDSPTAKEKVKAALLRTETAIKKIKESLT